MHANPRSFKRVKRFNHPGHAHFLTFSCYQRMPLLTNERWRTWLGEQIRTACDQKHFALWAYVIMPEHVHLLVHPVYRKYFIEDFLYAIKRPFALRVLTDVRKSSSPLIKKLAIQEKEGVRYRFWQPGGGYDVNLWSTEKAMQKAEYCHRNPVTRRLVKYPEQWRWSSFRWIELMKRDHEPLALDEWDDRTRPNP